ncbi:MAG: PEP-CTERM sorting domain-containing protein [Aquabacterium sp.]
MRHITTIALVAGAFCSLNAAALTVPGNASSVVDLGLFAAGSYDLTGSGVVDLCGNGTFRMNPDGTPNVPVTCSHYGPQFNPNGSYIADGNYGPAFLNAKLGALIGTLNAAAYTGANPTAMQAADWFLIGYGTTVVLGTTGHIYALVNDTFPVNNSGAFEVTVTAVPEPSTYALLAAGLLAVGATTRQRSAARQA